MIRKWTVILALLCIFSVVSVAFAQQQAPPRGFIDIITPNYVLTGWALDTDDPTQILQVHIYVDGTAGEGGTFIGAVPANIPRPDVNAETGYPGNYGFAFTIPTQYRTGTHTFYAHAIDYPTASNNPPLPCGAPQACPPTISAPAATATPVPPPTSTPLPAAAPPVGYVGTINANFVLSGWALDADWPSLSIPVRLYADGLIGAGGQFIMEATANIPRQDVNNATGLPGNHGFAFIIPTQYRTGIHTFYVYAIDTAPGTSNTLLPCGAQPCPPTISAPVATSTPIPPPTSTPLPAAAPPVGYVGTINANFVLSGWALDADWPSLSIPVRLYADGLIGAGGQFIMEATANIPRQDVNNATGLPGNHGFAFTIPTQYRTGTHTFYVYAIDTTPGTTNTLLPCGAQPCPPTISAPLATATPVPPPTATPTSGQCNSLYSEGEQATWQVGDSVIIRQDLSLSNGAYLDIPTISGNNVRRVTFCFHLASSGNYKIRLRSWGEYSGFLLWDSYSHSWGWGVPPSQTYQTVFVRAQTYNWQTEHIFELPSGQHTITLLLYPDTNARIDWIELVPYS